MTNSEVEQVLANWIGEALSPIGHLSEGTDRAKWIASCFAQWWRDRVKQTLDNAELAANGIYDELMTRLSRNGLDQKKYSGYPRGL